MQEQQQSLISYLNSKEEAAASAPIDASELAPQRLSSIQQLTMFKLPETMTAYGTDQGLHMRLHPPGLRGGASHWGNGSHSPSSGAVHHMHGWLQQQASMQLLKCQIPAGGQWTPT